MDLFCVSDLYELKDFKKVCIFILSVGRYSAKVDEFEGPFSLEAGSHTIEMLRLRRRRSTPMWIIRSAALAARVFCSRSV